MFFAKLKNISKLKIDTYNFGSKIKVIDIDVKPYNIKIDKEFFVLDLCNAYYLEKCKARCCKDIMKKVTLIFSNEDHEVLSLQVRKLTYPVLIDMNDKKFIYWGINIRDKCPFLEKSGTCSIHQVKPLMCQIPMIHFDLVDNVVHIKKRLYGDKFKESCILELKPFSDLSERISCEKRDFSTFSRIKREFEVLGIEHKVDKIIEEIQGTYVRIEDTSKEVVKKDNLVTDSVKGEEKLDFNAWR